MNKQSVDIIRSIAEYLGTRDKKNLMLTNSYFRRCLAKFFKAKTITEAALHGRMTMFTPEIIEINKNKYIEKRPIPIYASGNNCLIVIMDTGCTFTLILPNRIYQQGLQFSVKIGSGEDQSIKFVEPQNLNKSEPDQSSNAGNAQDPAEELMKYMESFTSGPKTLAFYLKPEVSKPIEEHIKKFLNIRAVTLDMPGFD